MNLLIVAKKIIAIINTIIFILGIICLIIFWENKLIFYIYVILIVVLLLLLNNLYIYLVDEIKRKHREEIDRLEKLYLRNAENHFKNNEYSKSIDYYTKILDIIPFNNLLYLEKRAYLYEQLNDYQKALHDYSQIEHCNKDSIKAIERKAEIFIKMQNYKDAIIEYSKIIELNPKSINALGKRAYLYFEIKEYKKSLIDYINAKDNGYLIDIKKIVEVWEKMLQINSIEAQSNLKAELQFDKDYKKKIRESLAEDPKISDYPNQVGDLKNISFENVRSISVKYINTLKINNPERTEVLLQRINRGTEILKTSEELHQYKYSYDLKHKHKLDNAFKSFFEKTKASTSHLNETIDIIDWGCGQALGTFVFLENLNKFSCSEINLNKIILVDPSEIALKRGVCLINNILKIEDRLNPLIRTVNKNVEEVCENDVLTLDSNIKIHILSNIIDLQDLKIFDLFSVICKSQRNKNYFICISPNFNPNGIVDYRNQKMLDFKSLFVDNFKNCTELSFKTAMIEQDTTTFENIFFVEINQTPENILINDYEKYELEFLKGQTYYEYMKDRPF